MKSTAFIDPYEYKKLEDHNCKKPLGNIKSIFSYDVNYTRYDYPNPNETKLVQSAYANADLVKISELSHLKKEYNTEGLLIKVSTKNGLERNEYHYELGHIKFAEQYKSDSLTKKNIYTTDNYGRIIKEKSVTTDNEVIDEMICIYDNEKIIEYNYKGGYSWGYQKTLDNKKRVISSRSLKYINGNFIPDSEYYSYKYLEHNKREKFEENLKCIEILNEKGFVVSRTIAPEYASKSKYHTMTFEYDNESRLINEIWTSPQLSDSIRFEYIYKFDDTGNVVYFARKSNFSTGSLKSEFSTDWETFYYNEYY